MNWLRLWRQADAGRSGVAALAWPGAWAGLFLLCACAGDAFGTDQGNGAGGSLPEEAAEYPNLSEVPDSPRPVAPVDVRAQIAADLESDRERATRNKSGREAGSQTAQAAIISSEGVSSGNPAAAYTGAGAMPADEEMAAIIFFKHGSAQLDREDTRVLEGVATLHRNRGGRIRVVGHSSARTRTTSAEEHSLTNFEMSMKRAAVVAEKLYDLGVDPQQVTAEAKSDADPIYHEFMPTGEAGNRRAEIYLEK